MKPQSVSTVPSQASCPFRLVGVRGAQSFVRSLRSTFRNHPTTPNPLSSKVCWFFFFFSFQSPKNTDSPLPCAFTRPGPVLSYFSITNCERPPTSASTNVKKCLRCRKAGSPARSLVIACFLGRWVVLPQRVGRRPRLSHFGASSHVFAAGA